MKITVLLLGLLLVGCGNPSRMQKARQNAACATNGFGSSLCNDGTHIPPGIWYHLKGPVVLKELQNEPHR